MDFSPLVLRELVTRLLDEDIGYGDITTLATVPPRRVVMDVCWPKKRSCWRDLKSLWPSSILSTVRFAWTVLCRMVRTSPLGALSLRFTVQPGPCSRLSG